MIQRIQSLFLLITILALGVFLATNSYSITVSANEAVVVNPYHIWHKVGTLGNDIPIFYVAVMAVISIIVALITLFLFKNRLRQVMFVALNALLMGATLAVTVYQALKVAKPMANGGEESFEIGFFALIVAMISNSLANYFIKKDEKTVRASDRMR